jgi:DEP domain-containing protein 5
MPQIQMLGLLDHDVLSGIQVPFLRDGAGPTDSPILSTVPPKPITQAEAEKFDLDTFAMPKKTRPGTISRNSFASSGSGTVIAQSWNERRGSLRDTHRSSVVSTSSLLSIPPIEESPLLTAAELPNDAPPRPPLLKTDSEATIKLSSSPSQASIRSMGSEKSNRSTSTIAATKPKAEERSPTSSTKGLLKPLWFLNPFKNTPAKPETASVNASATGSGGVPSTSSSVGVPIPSGSSPRPQTGLSRSPQPMRASPRRAALNRGWDDDPALSGSRHRTSSSPVNTPPRDEAFFGRRRNTTLSTHSLPFASSPISPTNPLRAHTSIPYTQYSLARRWQHVSPVPLYRHDVKFKAMVMPSCLPLTVEHFPTMSELETSYGVFSYDFVVDPVEMRSFLVRPPPLPQGTQLEDARRAVGFAVMRGMAAVRLAQGFQFVLQPREIIEKRGKGKAAVGRTATASSFASSEDEPNIFPELRMYGIVMLSI